jgi:hypothetical protein
MSTDLIVLSEHPEWQKPLFSALENRGVRFEKYDLTRACFDPDSLPKAALYFNQASPSAYLRGNARAVPLALALMRSLEFAGARVLNGSRAFALELSKSAQAALMQQLGIPHPRSLAFNDVNEVIEHWGNQWPALLKPEQGGSGARMYLLQSPDELVSVLQSVPDIWFPDNLLILQQYLESDPRQGIVRMEFLGGRLLYAMRVVSHGSFNLCPSEMCNPDSGTSLCQLPETQPVEFFPYPEVPFSAVEAGKRLMLAGGLDVGGVEYLESGDGTAMFYDLNANSNLRAPIAQAFGFDPFERVVDFLVDQIAATGRTAYGAD